MVHETKAKDVSNEFKSSMLLSSMTKGTSLALLLFLFAVDEEVVLILVILKIVGTMSPIDHVISPILNFGSALISRGALTRNFAAVLISDDDEDAACCCCCCVN